MTRRVPVTVTYLQMASPAMLHPGTREPEDVYLRLEQAPVAASLAAALYRQVGGSFYWVDRLSWTDADWQEAVNRDGVELWTARRGEEIAGYFELERDGDAIEIKYFGLVPGFAGRGLGGWMLTAAVNRAWALGPAKVTVNTCTLDSPNALANYLARGFTKVREMREMRELPE